MNINQNIYATQVWQQKKKEKNQVGAFFFN